MRVFANTLRQILPTANVLAEKRGKNDDNVVMAGAHLDSVIAGPGDQRQRLRLGRAPGDGAEQMAKVKPQNTMRFAWWAAEEQGLVGSTDYVDGPVAGGARPHRAVHELRHGRLAELHLHGVRRRRVDVPGAAGVTIPPGSEAIEDVYESLLHAGSASRTTTREFSGRSDYQAFIQNGIPAGGLFTGAEVIKTAEQQAIWGGTAGEQFDPCYHLACDTYDNINLHALRVNSDLIAFAQLTFAYSTESVNGVRGKRVPGKRLRLPAPAGPGGHVRRRGRRRRAAPRRLD